jgi:hypothetical protein
MYEWSLVERKTWVIAERDLTTLFSGKSQCNNSKWFIYRSKTFNRWENSVYRL